MLSKSNKLCLECILIIVFCVFLVFFYIFKFKNNYEFPIVPIDSSDSDYVYSIKGLGPNGEQPNEVASIITSLAKLDPVVIEAKNYKVAVAMHDLDNDWSRAVVSGIKDSLAYYGISPYIITDGEFDIKKQLADYKNILNLKPDVLITLPVDTYDTSEALLEIQKSGTNIVFIDTVADGFTFPDKYQGWVVGDSYVLGSASVKILADKLNAKGKVALLLWKNKMFTVDQRAKGAKAMLKEYPNIDVVKEVYFEEFYQIKGLIEDLLIKHPDLDGLWAVWDTPAFEAINVLKAKKANVIVTCVDMSADVAKSIISDDILVGTAADHPYDAGIGVALLALGSLENIQLKDYYVVPAEAITSSNINEAWMNIYKQPIDVNKL